MTLRRDIAIWGGALVLGAAGTAVAWAAGARLGAALTLGVVMVMVLVLGALVRERSGPSDGA